MRHLIKAFIITVLLVWGYFNLAKPTLQRYDDAKRMVKVADEVREWDEWLKSIDSQEVLY